MRRSRRWWARAATTSALIASARRALAGCFVCVLVASGVLVTAIVRHDFRFASVAEHSSREVPQPYLISSFWSSQEGSLLLWLLVLSGLSALVTYQHRRRSRELMPYLVAFLGGACAFFAFATSFVASPFATVAQVPRDGAGLVPSLQNPYMLTHPPLLYLGYVGFTIPFAFAMAALVSGRTDGRWLQAVRRWTLVPWLALGVGMLLGAKWAYEEIGWGGFWGWDPVENAALIPWLTATAFLHSVIVQEKKGMLKVWNVSLVALTYVLCIVGTFLTRSGFTSSIHTFVVSSVGWWFIGYIAIVATVAIVVIVAQPRSAALAAPDRLAGLARGDVPVQQPAVRGARVRDPLGRPVPVDLRGAGGTPGRHAVALLRLLRRRARPAAAAAGRRRARWSPGAAHRCAASCRPSAGPSSRLSRREPPWSCSASHRACPAWSRSASACS